MSGDTTSLGRRPSRLPSTNLADAFTNSEPPARSAGLAGRLAPVPAHTDQPARPATTGEAEQGEPAQPTHPPQPDAPPTAVSLPTRRPRPADKPVSTRGRVGAATSGLRTVIVYIPLSVRDRLKRVATATGATYTQAVLASVEANHRRLADLIAETSGTGDDTAPPGGLFSTPVVRRPRRDEPNVQISIRITQQDLDVLDQLTHDHAVASRSALISAALDGHLPH